MLARRRKDLERERNWLSPRKTTPNYASDESADGDGDAREPLGRSVRQWRTVSGASPTKQASPSRQPSPEEEACPRGPGRGGRERADEQAVLRARLRELDRSAGQRSMTAAELNVMVDRLEKERDEGLQVTPRPPAPPQQAPRRTSHRNTDSCVCTVVLHCCAAGQRRIAAGQLGAAG